MEWKVVVSGKGWRFRNCNSFPCTCNQEEPKNVSTHRALLPSHSGLQLDYAEISSPDIFSSLLLLCSIVSSYIYTSKWSNSNLKCTLTKKTLICTWIETLVWLGLSWDRDLPVVLGALQTRQLIAFDFTELWVKRILKSNIFHRCLHLIASFWKDKNFTGAYFCLQIWLEFIW